VFINNEEIIFKWMMHGSKRANKIFDFDGLFDLDFFSKDNLFYFFVYSKKILLGKKKKVS